MKKHKTYKKLVKEFMGAVHDLKLKKLRTRPFPHYDMCAACAKDAGGVMKAGHVCTVSHGICEYCGAPGVTLIPWVDFNWPDDAKIDKIAKNNRD